MSGSGLTPEQFRLLQGVAAGELEPNDPAVATAATDPLFAEELRLLLAVHDELDSARSEIEGFDRGQEPFDGADALVRDEVRRLARRDGFGGESSRRGIWQWVLAAAAVLAIGATVWFLSAGTDDVPGPGALGGGEIQEMSPDGAVADYGVFQWGWDLGPGEYFVVTVYTSDRTAEVVRVEDLDTNEWTPMIELPDAIVWEVRVIDSLGGEVGSGEAEARRR